MLLSRSSAKQLIARFLITRTTSSNRTYAKDSSSSSSSSSSSDDEKKPKKTKVRKAAAQSTDIENEQKESASARLNRLLTSMPTDNNFGTSRELPGTTAPGETLRKRKEATKSANSKNIFTAAKEVASHIDGKSDGQTESELLSKLLGHVDQKDSHASNDQQKSDFGLSDLIVKMKIDRSKKQKEYSRSDFVRRQITGRQQHPEKQLQQRPMMKREKRDAEAYTGSVRLFTSDPLGIFKDVTQLRESSDLLQTWNQLEQHELKLQSSHPPANYFEKMALWTERGRVWRFPIDNEQDISDEENVDFSEHIFLEQHLEPWCPNKGPIRHFMELVCVGLSSNPYITAKDKKDHIMWYRNYFEEKKCIKTFEE